MENLKQMHIHAINKMVENGEMIPTKNLEIKMLNLEEFKFKVKGKGIVNIAELIKVKEFIDNSIGGISSACRTFIYYHKDSPRYWGNIGDKIEDFKAYNVQINLEPFMPDDSEMEEVAPDFFVPDNYVLAEKMLKEFEKAGNKIGGIEDHAYRECANWYIKSKPTAKKLIKFIDTNYVQPRVKELMESYGIKKINFLEKRMDFVFKKKKKK